MPGVTVLNVGYFNELTVLVPRNASDVVHELAERKVLGGVSLGRLYPDAPDLHRGLLLAATETTTPEDIEELGSALEEVLA